MTFRRFAAVLAIAAVAGLVALQPAKAEPRQYQVDPEHFAIVFMVHHLGLADTVGMFREASGSFTYDAEAQTLSDVEITVQTDSVFTNHEARDNHLRGTDFLNVQEYPTMTFTADEAEVTGENSGKIHGELTLLGETHPLTLDVTYEGGRTYPFGDGHYAIGISARGTVQRSEYGMTYAVDNGLVGDEIELIIEFEGIRQPKEE
ncbi:YceI family protein [Rhodovibrio salinarum]|uniref:YceI family protein n=1 Tax=Rhodovibrio salinarum TaxID=1087 RepID=A0A934V0L2_9PROT|nr:YceI family protein [Rhodovibrio salinarum]MBK1697570.1 YceI family protein [Rhodovibrio salinarum]